MVRCEACGRKAGPLPFACPCGGRFCGACRMPEAHACPFDHAARTAPKLDPARADKVPNRLR